MIVVRQGITFTNVSFDINGSLHLEVTAEECS